jgi:AraC family transcriptional regulator
VQFIQERFSEDIALADIAAAARVSPYHLTRIFKQATGMSPHQYLIQVRVTNARALLMAGAGRRSVAEVADAVGFSDQSHLTRHMKRLLGVTPGEVRAA